MFPGRIRPIAIFKEKSKRISKHEKRKQDRSQIQIGQAPVCSIGGGERKAAFGTGKQQVNIPERKAGSSARIHVLSGNTVGERRK